MSVDVLKLQISAPNAHFRVVHSSEPQKTYPVPPYSTIIGFLSNILGDKEYIESMLNGDLALGILSKYNYITREYTWLRNLHPAAHIKRFGSQGNRFWSEVSEHAGGQSPVSIEVLNDVHLALYIYHPNSALLEMLQKNIVCPEKWYSHLHLGRAEDWAAVNSVSVISLILSNSPADLRNSSQYYQWMPEPAFTFGIGDYINEKHYKELYHKIQGPAMLVTSIYNLVKVPYMEKKGTRVITRNDIIRNFKHVPTRLTDSPIPFLDDFMLPTVFTDPKLKTSIYMANIAGSSNTKGGFGHAK